MKSLIYVDNSNVSIEGRYVSAVKKFAAENIYCAHDRCIFDRDWKVDFGRLLYFAGGESRDIKKAVIFGSQPPEWDSLWAAAKKRGFEVVVYERDNRNKEKKIDTAIVATMMADSYEIINPDEDEMILIAGDSDYVPAIEKIRKRGIRVVVCFWNHAAIDLKASCDKFIDLDPYVSNLKLNFSSDSDLNMCRLH